MITFEEYSFFKQDRIQKIKQIYEEHDLENNAYISFSGGLDSTILHYLFDMAVPQNKIPRLFINTGLEFILTVKFVKKLQKQDPRIQIINNDLSITKILKEHGYPVKSKNFSHKMHYVQQGKQNKSVDKFINEKWNKLPIPLKPLVQENRFPFKVNDTCCYYFKKRLANKWQKENGKKIKITGMRQEEGGNRTQLSCLLVKGNSIKAFHPLAPITEDFIQSFVKYENISINPLYKSPFNFKRTGCRGCPFSLTIQKDLEIMQKLLPVDYFSANSTFGNVYNLYRNIGYRLQI